MHPPKRKPGVQRALWRAKLLKAESEIPRSVDGTVGFTPRLGAGGKSRPKQNLLMPSKGVYPNIYTLRMPQGSWQVLLWMFFRVEDNGGTIFKYGWKSRCARECGISRTHLSERATLVLAVNGFVVPLGEGKNRYVSVRFVVERFVG